MKKNSIALFLLKKSKRYIIKIVVCSFICSFLGILTYIIPGYVINSIIYLKSLEKTYELLSIFVGIVLANIIFNYIKNIMVIKTELLLKNQMVESILSHSYNIDSMELKKYNDVYLTQRIINDVDFIVRIYTNSISNILSSLLLCIGAITVVAKINYRFSIIIIISIPIYIFYVFFIRNRISLINKEQKEQRDKYISSINKQIKLVDTIKNNNLEEVAINLVENDFKRFYNISLKTYKTNFSINFFETNLTMIIRIIFYILGASLIMQESLSYGFFSIIISLYALIVSSIKYFMNIYKEILETKISVSRLQEIYEMRKEEFGQEPLINIHDISMDAGEFDITSGIKLKYPQIYLKKGDICWIGGKNGSGKTTLFHLITGIYNHQGIKIFINNKPMDQMNIKKYRNLISYIQQEPEFWDLTVEENICYFLKRKIEYGEFCDLLNKKEISYIVGRDFISRDLWKRKVTEISPGQRKKLMLCIQLSKNSDMILLDEPNATLDRESITALKEWLILNKEKYITLLISHDKDYKLKSTAHVEI